MNILYYDCFAGCSGDMNLAAMLDLGVDADHLRSELDKLGLEDEFELQVTRDQRGGISGTRVDVVVEKGASDQNHRTMADIEALIGRSGLDEAVQRTSLAMFHRVARAEAKVHGTTVREVHFHEVGATDSIVDMVGAAICFHALEIDAVWCSPVELGDGVVSCAHGTLPVPAPATAEILHGIPTTRGGVRQEATTPTGAAILAELCDRFVEQPAMTLTATGYGVGHRDSDQTNVLPNTLPNVLRVHLAQAREAGKSLPVQNTRLLMCNIDDMTGEALGVALEELMAAGAMDVHLAPIVMKKSRPAHTLSLFCAEADQERFQRLVFRHTSTLGIKSVAVDKTALDISFATLETPLGPVTMKHAHLDGEIIRSKPELEDCRRLAREHDIPLAEVMLAIGKVRKT